MSNYYTPCFYRINFVVIPSYIELPVEFCWWCRFYKLKLRAITKRCTYRLINVLAVFKISPGSFCCGFLLNKIFNFIAEETLRRLLSGWSQNLVWRKPLCLYLCYIIITIIFVIININISIVMITVLLS